MQLRFKGSHTYDKIAEMLFEIQSSFKLRHDQVVSTTTDNGSNFVKAFREFGFTDYVPDFSNDIIEGKKNIIYIKYRIDIDNLSKLKFHIVGLITLFAVFYSKQY